MAFTPALIVVDMQNDFCPPDGSLAVTGGRDIVPLVNKLLQSPSFAVKVGTKDYHPQKHVSFASNHPGKEPFSSFAEVRNHIGGKPDETMQQRLWPDHCVQGTRGAEILDEIDSSKFDLVLHKGASGGASHDLAQVLREKGITHVYNVGLAGDYCVKDTAIGAARAGFVSYIIEEGQRCVDAAAWSNCQKEIGEASVHVVSMDGDEVKRILQTST